MSVTRNQAKQALTCCLVVYPHTWIATVCHDRPGEVDHAINCPCNLLIEAHKTTFNLVWLNYEGMLVFPSL